MCREPQLGCRDQSCASNQQKHLSLWSVQKRKAFAVSGRLLRVLLEPPEGDSALCKMTLRLRELNQGLERALGPVLGSGMRVRHPLGCLMLLALERMVHGNKKAALGPYEDSCCNL